MTEKFSKKVITLNLKKELSTHLTQKRDALFWLYFMQEQMN